MGAPRIAAFSGADEHRTRLRALPAADWDGYLAAHSGLPGPRANLELIQAVADEADGDRIRRYAASQDEFQAVCGAVGLGRLLVDDRNLASWLRSLAGDGRWRVREGVAMALQRLGDADPPALAELAGEWARGTPLEQRAAIAGICEPRLLRHRRAALAALDLLDQVTASLSGRAVRERRLDEVRVLRKALGYCWSVAVAAWPADGFPRLERWASVDDVDVRWVVRENLKKARLVKADAAGAQRLASVLDRGSKH